MLLSTYKQYRDSTQHLQCLSMKAIFFLFLALLISTPCVFAFSDEYGYVKLPTDLYDAKMLGQVLSRYSDQHYYQVLLAFFVIFILYLFVGTNCYSVDILLCIVIM